MSFLINIDRRIGDGNALLKQGIWHKGSFAKCRGIMGNTLGLIGFDNIAQLVAKRGQGLEMDILVDDTHAEAGLDKKLDFKYVPRE